MSANTNASYCSFRVRHPRWTAEAIVEAIGLEPTTSRTVGTQRIGLDGRKLQGEWKESYCVFQVDLGFASSIEDGLGVFVRHLGERASVLKRLRAAGGRLEFFVTWVFQAQTGVVFELGLLQQLAELGASLEIEGACPRAALESVAKT